MKRILITALLAGGVLFMSGAATAGVSYTYYGYKGGRTSGTVRLVSANVVSGHAAVWLGANTRDLDGWVQGGVAAFHSSLAPVAYIEVKHHHKPPTLQMWPLADFTASVHVKLTRHMGHERVTISFNGESHTSDPVRMRKPVKGEVLEIWQQAAVVGMEQSDVVRASTLGY